MSEPQAATAIPTWRRVLGEIAIIVLGVLIALAVNDCIDELQATP